MIDSFAWIEYLSSGPHGAQVREVLEGDHELLTPDLVLGEVSRKLARDGQPRESIQTHLGVMATLTSIIPLSIPVALAIPSADEDLRASAKARRLPTPGLAGAVVLASARARGAKVLTGDRHFQTLDETLWIG